MEMYNRIHQSSLSMCCDIVARMTNELQSLLQDMEVLLEQQIAHQGSQAKYNQSLVELQEKLASVHQNKEGDFLGQQCFDDFITFIKTVWIKVNKFINRNLRSAKFLSVKRGIPLSVLAEELLDFCFHCSFTYKNIFIHTHCIKQFDFIYDQLSNVIFPEVQYSDDFKQASLFVQTASPCLISLLGIVEKFITEPEYTDVESLCQGEIDNEPTTFEKGRNLGILVCGDLLMGPVEEEVLKLKSLYASIDKMTDHILKRRGAAAPSIERPGGTGNRLAGILNSKYMSCVHPANMSPRIYSIRLQASQKDSPLTTRVTAVHRTIPYYVHPSPGPSIKRKRRAYTLEDFSTQNMNSPISPS